jgi:tRNA (guanine37-N1)-methyltransferase
LPACIVVDAIGRLIPGVLNDESSALLDSFQDDMLSAPVFTRPAEYKGWKVPDVLLSGNERLINKWRDEQALKRTEERRPDLLGK